MLVTPIVIYLATFPVSGRLRPRVCKIYRTTGGIVVFFGSATSVYFAAYTGDQGGIAAFYFQVVVIFAYLILSTFLLTANYFFTKRDKNRNES